MFLIDRKFINNLFYFIFAFWLHLFSIVFLLFDDVSNSVLQVIIFTLFIFLVFYHFNDNGGRASVSAVPVYFFFWIVVFYSVVSIKFMEVKVYVRLINLVFVVYSIYIISNFSQFWFEKITRYYSILSVVVLLIFSVKVSMIDHRNDLDIQPNYIGMVALSSVAMAFLGGVPAWNRCLIYVLSLFLVTVVSSRASMILIAMFIFFEIALYNGYVNYKKVIFLAVAVIIGGLFGFEYISQILMLDDSYRGVGTDFSGRGYRWQLAYLSWLQNPMFGFGYGQSTEVIGNTVDSAYFAILLDLGLIGAILYLLFNSYVLMKSFYNKDYKSFVFLIAFLIYGVFEKRYWSIGNGWSLIYYLVLFRVLSSSRGKVNVDFKEK